MASLNFIPLEEFTRPRNEWPGGATLLSRIGHFSQRAENGCLEWTGTLSSGRPVLKVGMRTCLVSRLIWIYHRGEIPEGKIIRHVKCRNKKCIDIDHLDVGTHLDNAKDRDNDGMTAKGSSHYKAILTDDLVREILLHNESHNAAALKYGVGRSTIVNIRLGNTWKHIPRKTS